MQSIVHLLNQEIVCARKFIAQIDGIYVTLQPYKVFFIAFIRKNLGSGFESKKKAIFEPAEEWSKY